MNNIKTFMAIAVVALTAACSEQPATETVAGGPATVEAPEPNNISENEQPR